MRLTIVSRIAVVAAFALIASTVSAQSLADVARQEEARRAAVKAAARAKVLTNADLAADPRAGAIATAAPAAAVAVVPASTSPGNASAGAAMAAAAPTTKPKENEGYWRSRAAEHRARIEKAQKGVDALAGAAHEDPREQARVESLVKRAQDELTRANDALRLLVMQADIAGVPAAWVK